MFTNYFGDGGFWLRKLKIAKVYVNEDDLNLYSTYE